MPFFCLRRMGCLTFSFSLCRAPVDSRVPTGASLSNNDQFHRETSSVRQPTTEPIQPAGETDFVDQWEAPAPQRQQPIQQRPIGRQPERIVPTTTEFPLRAPVQSSSQFSEPDVDYHGFPVDELATSEPSIDQFADYDIFEDRKLYLLFFFLNFKLKELIE